MRKKIRFGYTYPMRTALVAAAFSVAAGTLFAQRLIWLGTLGGDWSTAYDVSADGTVVVGVSDVNRQNRAFRWTVSGGMQDLGAPGDSIAYGVSADGSVVVGVSNSRAFRWTTPSVIQYLGVLQGASWSVAYDVSANGSVVVGDSGRRGFRWTEAGGMQPINSFLPESSVSAVSADGSVAVGSVPGYNQRLFAYRWNADGSSTNLSYWSSERAVALGVSPDGAVAVGWGSRGDDGWWQRAWAWWGQVGGVRLPSQSQAFAHAVSGNGVIVGRNSSWRAIRWVHCNGRDVEQDLNTVYSSLLSSGSSLSVAYAISPNGRYIVGRGYNAATGRNEAYLLDTCGHNGDVDGNGCVDDADLLRVLFAFGGTSTVCDPKREDVNCDGVIDDADLLIVLFNFGTGC
jgi:probable HAF family extracellular repeat protein